MERLDKFLADRTELSRKDVKNSLKNGEAVINGKIVTDPSFKTDPEKDEIIFRGKKIVFRKNTYLMLNKPDGVVSSTKDGRSETVLSLVPEEMSIKGLFPAGRLDKDSKGFVFLTDDGELAHRMLSPKKHVAKYYLVRLRDVYDTGYEEKFEKGLVIDGDEECLPAVVRGFEEDEHFALVELHEGKFHQVKRMFASVGNEVESLFRTRIGSLDISPELMPGQVLELLNNDVEKILTKKSFEDAYFQVRKSFWLYLINNKL